MSVARSRRDRSITQKNDATSIGSKRRKAHRAKVNSNMALGRRLCLISRVGMIVGLGMNARFW